MAQLRLSLLLLVLSIFSIMGTVEPSFGRRSRAPTYVEVACRSTRFPRLCVQCLSGFANKSKLQSPQQLAQFALAVSLYRAQRTRAYLLKVAKQLKATKAVEYQTVQDCVDQINNGIDQLSQSIKELRSLKEETLNGNTIFHINNIYTWMSSALTDASNCAAQFPVRRMSKQKAIIKGKVLNVAEVTSNALALFHQYAARYQAGATKKP